MNCKFCDQELPEQAEKCPHCGIPVRSNQKQMTDMATDASVVTTYRTLDAGLTTESVAQVIPPEERYIQVERKSRRNRLIAICCILLVLILLVTGYFVFFTGYRAAIRRYVNGRESLSGFRYTTIVPDAFLDGIEKNYNMNRKEIRTCLDGYFAYAITQMEADFGGNIQFGYERDSQTIYTDTETLAEYEETILSKYQLEMDIQKVTLANIRISMSGDEQSSTDKLTLTLFQCGRKWYCLEAMEQVDYACQYDGYDLW